MNIDVKYKSSAKQRCNRAFKNTLLQEERKVLTPLASSCHLITSQLCKLSVRTAEQS